MRITITGLFLLGAASLFALEPAKSLNCDNQSHNGRPTYCEIREQSMPAGGNPLSIDGKSNGGVSVKGWDQAGVLVRAKVVASGDTDADARATVAQVRVLTAGGQVSAEGPQSQGGNWWAVSYEVFVPHASSVSVKTHNGGVSIADVQGRVQFEAKNGGVHLTSVSGDVRGRTTNGGLHIELDGDRWNGPGMDVSTTNGGVKLLVPANYSARLEAATTNGRVKLDYPAPVTEAVERHLSTSIGAGGALLRAVTTNGGVVISKR